MQMNRTVSLRMSTLVICASVDSWCAMRATGSTTRAPWKSGRSLPPPMSPDSSAFFTRCRFCRLCRGLQSGCSKYLITFSFGGDSLDIHVQCSEEGDEETLMRTLDLFLPTAQTCISAQLRAWSMIGSAISLSGDGLTLCLHPSPRKERTDDDSDWSEKARAFCHPRSLSSAHCFGSFVCCHAARAVSFNLEAFRDCRPPATRDRYSHRSTAIVIMWIAISSSAAFHTTGSELQKIVHDNTLMFL